MHRDALMIGAPGTGSGTAGHCACVGLLKVSVQVHTPHRVFLRTGPALCVAEVMVWGGNIPLVPRTLSRASVPDRLLSFSEAATEIWCRMT